MLQVSQLLQSPSLSTKTTPSIRRSIPLLSKTISTSPQTNTTQHKKLQKKQERSLLSFKSPTKTLKVQSLLTSLTQSPSKDTPTLINIIKHHASVQSVSDLNHLLAELIIDSEFHDLTLQLCCPNNELLGFGFDPDHRSFLILINALCKRGRMEKAFLVFDVMKECGVRPSVEVHNCLLKGLCYVGRVEEAFELLRHVKSSKELGLGPDIYSYSVVMDGFCKVGRTDEAVELLDEAVEMGLDPSPVTFNALFEGYSKEGRPMKGFVVLRWMKEQGCVPDSISYNTLLHGLVLWGKVRAALRVYYEMVELELEVNDRAVNNLLRGLCRETAKQDGLFGDLCKLFDEMNRTATPVDRSTYAFVIQALCFSKKFNDALRVLVEMIGSGNLPRVVTINKVIRGLCFEGHLDDAASLLVFMFENNKIPTRLSYELLIHESNRQGRFSGACSVYSAALVRGVVPHKMPRR